MPKDRRVNSSSFDRSMVSPYPCSSKISDCKNSRRSSHHVGDEKEWEDIRCPICMEQPHNAVLLLCSSRDKGCRPFICDTSYRHSNCFDQYKRSSATANVFSLLDKKSDELVCPFCRGTITGCDVMDPVRKFLNSKTRSCSLETCSFRGSYAELRKHARAEHPLKRPSEVSPTRKSNWTVQEQQRETEDALVHQSDMDYIHVPGSDNMDIHFEWDEYEFWNLRNEFLGNLEEDDFWSGERFFDFPSGMSDGGEGLSFLSDISMPMFSPYLSPHDEDMMDSGNSRSREQQLQLPMFSPYLSSHGDDMMDSGNSRSRDQQQLQQPAISGSIWDGYLGNANQSSESRSRSHSEDEAADALRSIAEHPRVNDSLNLSLGSGYDRENGRAVSSNRPSSNASRSRSRSRYEREITPERLRRRWSYRWEDWDDEPILRM